MTLPCSAFALFFPQGDGSVRLAVCVCVFLEEKRHGLSFIDREGTVQERTEIGIFVYSLERTFYNKHVKILIPNLYVTGFH